MFSRSSNEPIFDVCDLDPDLYEVASDLEYRDDGAAMDGVTDRLPDGESSQLKQPVSGRFRGAKARWKRAGASPWMLSIIEHGLELPFCAFEGRQTPAPQVVGRNNVPDEMLAWTRKAVDELVAMGSAQVCATRPHLVSPLLVCRKPSWTPENPKFRLCHDLRVLNLYIKRFTFELERLSAFGKLLRRGDYLFSIDYESAYYHVEIHRRHWKYLGFEFEGKYYVFTCLPFGLSCAPFVFTMFAALTADTLRYELRLRVCSYIDDLLLATEFLDPQIVKRALVVVRSFGWSVNEAKCMLTLARRLKGLGFIIDTDLMVFEVPESRRVKMLQVARDVLSRASHCPARWVARLAGHRLAMQLALGIACRLRSRFLLKCVEDVAIVGDWNRLVALFPAAIKEVNFWLRDLDSLAPQPVHPLKRRPSFVMECDTSDSASAGILLRAPGGPADVCMWQRLSPEETLFGSALRELLGYVRCLRALANRFDLTGHVVQVIVDAQAAKRLFERGGSQKSWHDGVMRLHEVVLDLYRFASEHGCVVTMRWRPRKFLHESDALSKYVDTQDFSLCHDVWVYVLREFGPFDVDRFAADHNTVCDVFNSKFDSEHSSGTDALAQDWSGVRNYCLPEFGMGNTAVISLVLDIIERDDCHCLLIVPVWPRAMWWHRLWTLPGRRRYEYLMGSSLVPNSGSCWWGSEFRSRVVLVEFEPVVGR